MWYEHAMDTHTDELMDNEKVVYTFQLKKNVATWIKRKDITLRDIS